MHVPWHADTPVYALCVYTCAHTHSHTQAIHKNKIKFENDNDPIHVLNSILKVF